MTNICRSPLKKEGGNRLQERWSRNTKVEFTFSKRGFPTTQRYFCPLARNVRFAFMCTPGLRSFPPPSFLLPSPGTQHWRKQGKWGEKECEK